jgi:hypothetical protein
MNAADINNDLETSDVSGATSTRTRRDRKNVRAATANRVYRIHEADSSFGNW